MVGLETPIVLRDQVVAFSVRANQLFSMWE